MRVMLISVIALVFSFSISKAEETVPAPLQSPVFDSVLAEKLGADDYGMHRYVIAFLKAGPNRDQDSTETHKLQVGHMNNIKRLADEGKLVLAGPFLDDGELRGIFIFNVSTVEEAKKLTDTDPAIIAGRLEMELHPWYGSAALMQVRGIHKKIKKNEF